MTCDNFETYYLCLMWNYVEKKTKCGNTKVDGSRAICDTCAANADRMAEINRQYANIEADQINRRGYSRSR
jgi:hypothetical protein